MPLSNRLSPLLLAGLFMIAGGLPSARSTDAPTVQLMAITELKSGQNGHFFVRADINNSGIMVIVDTGASTVALRYEDAQKIGLRPHTLDYSIPVSTANGMAKAAVVMLDEVEIDGVRVSNVQGMVMPEGAMQSSLLGMSFLSKLTSFRVENGVLYLKN
jgi:aspartyl protease family protein